MVLLWQCYRARTGSWVLCFEKDLGQGAESQFSRYLLEFVNIEEDIVPPHDPVTQAAIILG